MLRFLTTTLILVNVLFFISCQPEADKSSETGGDITHYEGKPTGPGPINIDGQLFSIPSPIESAMFIQKQGSGFQESYLLSTSSLDAYSTAGEKAIALGVYGAELGYVSLFNEDEKALGYMNACRKLADDIGLSSAFDERLVERFANNMGDSDSTVVMVSEIYEAADIYLKSNERVDMAALVLLGGWIESLHVTCNEAKADNRAIVDRLAEQKEGFTRLKELVERFESNSTIINLKPLIDELDKAFEAVSTTYIYQKPEVDLENQLTVFKSEVKHQMDDAAKEQIINATNALRNHIIGKI